MMKRKKKNTIKLSISLVLLTVLSIGLGYTFHKIFNGTKPTIKNSDEINYEVKPFERKISLVMVGDALYHDGVYKDCYDSSTKTYDCTHQLELIKPIVSNFDLAFYNQETILGGKELGLSGWPNFNSPYEVGEAFIDAGFNLVSTATNHSYDKKEQGILNSREFWLKQTDLGVIAAGTYKSAQDRKESMTKIYEKNGITYAFLAYTKGLNGYTLPNDKDYLANIFDYEQAKKDIEAVRDKVDVVIVSMHWGKDVTSFTNPSAEPWTKYPKGKNPKEQAEFLASLGVNIIIGHHPHIINPIEFIDDTLVIYSLGNFISAQSSDSDYNKRVGLMTMVDIVKTTTNNETKITLENLDNELLYTHISNGSFKVIPYSQMNSSYNKKYQSLYEKYSKVIKMYDSSINVKPLNES